MKRFGSRFICLLACSKRSDSGERCEVKKAMKSSGGLGREAREPVTSPPSSLLFFRAPFSSHRSPLSECLEQAICLRNEVGFLSLSECASLLFCSEVADYIPKNKLIF